MAKKRKAKKKRARKSRAKKGRKGMWSTADVNMLKKLFSENPTAMIAKQLRRSVDTVKKKASRMGLKKSKRYLKKIGRA